MKVGDEIDTSRRCQIDVGGVADDEHHAPRVCRGKFGNEIGDRMNFCVFCKVANKGGKRQNDDVV